MTGEELTHTVKDLGTWLSGKHLPCMCCLEFGPQNLVNKQTKKGSRLRKYTIRFMDKKTRMEKWLQFSTAVFSH